MWCHGDAITKDSSWASVWVSVLDGEWDGQMDKVSRRSRAVTLWFTPVPPPPSCSTLLLCSLFSPLWQTLIPNIVQLDAAVNIPPYRPPLIPVFVFLWMVVDLPLAPARGSSFLLASLLNQTVCSLKWPIPQIYRLEITRQLPAFNLSSNMNTVIK